MKCDKHPEEESIALCVSCRKPLCDDCRIQLHRKSYCQECADKIVENKKASEKVNDFHQNEETNSNESHTQNKGEDLGLRAQKTFENSLDRFSEVLNEKGITDEFQKFKERSSTGFKDLFADPMEEIKKAKELLDMGAITEEEFEIIKKKYLK